MTWKEALLPYVKQVAEHGLAGLVSAATLYMSGAHTPAELIAAFMLGAGLSAKPNNLLHA